MGSPGDKELELRVEINLPREAKMLRAIHAEKAALEVPKVRRQRAETKLYGSPTSRRWYEEECPVKEAEGFMSGRVGGQAPWMPWKPRGKRISGSKEVDQQHCQRLHRCREGKDRGFLSFSSLLRSHNPLLTFPSSHLTPISFWLESPPLREAEDILLLLLFYF